MRIRETNKTTWAVYSCYQLTTVFRDVDKIKVYTRDIHNDGVSYLELVRLEEYERKHRK